PSGGWTWVRRRRPDSRASGWFAGSSGAWREAATLRFGLGGGRRGGDVGTHQLTHHLVTRAELGDHAALQDHDDVGDAEQVHLVGDEDNRASGGFKALDRLHQGDLARGVETGVGL